MEVPWEQGIRHGEDVNVDNAFRLVCDCVDELEKNGIKYWFNWGLLLGAVRNKGFIPYDTDHDITVHWEDREKIWNIIEPAMIAKGCVVPPKEVCFPEDRFFIRDLEKIELNFVEDRGDKYTYSPNRCPLGCQKRFLDKLDTIEFYGRKFTIPSFAEEYLEKSYGSDWRVPIKGKKPRSL